MASTLTEEEMRVLDKFGFKWKGSIFVHKKMGIEKKMDYFSGFSSLQELENHIKSLLRTA